MQPLQYDLRCPAAKDNSITHAAAAPSDLDASITMRYRDIESQNTIELRATAWEIAAPKPDLGAKVKKNTILKHFLKGILKGKSQAPKWKSSGKSLQEVDNVIPPRPKFWSFPHVNAIFKKSSLCHPFGLWPTVNATNPWSFFVVTFGQEEWVAFYLDCVSLVQNFRGPGHGRCLPHCKRNKSPLVMKRQNLKVDVICVRLCFVGSKWLRNTNMEGVFPTGNATKIPWWWNVQSSKLVWFVFVFYWFKVIAQHAHGRGLPHWKRQKFKGRRKKLDNVFESGNYNYWLTAKNKRSFPQNAKARWIVPPGVRSVPCLCVHETWCTEGGPCTLGNWGSCWASGPSWIPRGTAKKKAARSCALWHTAASDSPANLLRYSPHGWRAANLRPETESASESSNKFPNGFWSWEPGESEVYAKSAFNFSTV